MPNFYYISNKKYKMQELMSYLLKKAKLVSQLKLPSQNQREAMLNKMKSIKKQDEESSIIQHKMLSSLQPTYFEQQKDLQKIYCFFFAVMKCLCKKFEFVPQEKQIYLRILEMNCKFYQKQGAFDRAELIKMKIENNPKQQGSFIIKLIEMIFAWTKIKLNSTIQQLQSIINRNSVMQKISSPKKYEIQLLGQDCQNLVNQIKFQGKSMNIYSSTKLQKRNLLTETKAQFGKKHLSLFTQEQQVFNLKKQFTEKGCDLSTRISTTYENQKSEQLVQKSFQIKNRSSSFTKSYIQRQKSLRFLPNINKDIFYGTFSQEMNQLYKNLDHVMEIDMYFLCSLRRQKQELREEIIQCRMNEVVNTMIRNMPKIQKSIKNYDHSYKKLCPVYIKTFHSQNEIRQKPQIKIHKRLKKLKSTSLQKSIRQSVIEKSERQKCSFPQKFMSQRGVKSNDQQIQNLFKNPKTNKIFKQRNKSFQQKLSKNLSKEKAQAETKYPAIYSPELFLLKQDLKNENGFQIDQKIQNFTTSTNKLKSKGLIRYKLLNKQRQSPIRQHEKFVTQKKINPDLIQTKKLSQFEVANIRKLLRIRQKQKNLNNKTPIMSDFKDKKQDIDQLMDQVRIFDSQRSKQLNQLHKTNKYQIFLSTLSDIKNGFKLGEKSTNFVALQDNDYFLSSRKKNKEYLPKII